MGFDMDMLNAGFDALSAMYRHDEAVGQIVKDYVGEIKPTWDDLRSEVEKYTYQIMTDCTAELAAVGATPQDVYHRTYDWLECLEIAYLW